MAFDSGGGVAEGFGDDGHRCEFGELVEGTESRGPGAEQLAEARCEVSGVNVTPGLGSAEYPGGVGTRCGQVTAWICGEFPPWLVQGIRQSDLDGLELDGDQFFGYGRVVPR